MADRALFLDRDGTIIVDKDYLADPDGVEFIEGSIEALRLAAALGFRLFVLTNQSGVARGLHSEADAIAVNERFEQLLKEQGIKLAGLYYCPHHPDFTGPCECRKPGRGMVDMALRGHNIDLGKSYVIGDYRSDIQLATNIGARAILVATGYGSAQRRSVGERLHYAYYAENLLDAVKWIEANE